MNLMWALLFGGAMSWGLIHWARRAMQQDRSERGGKDPHVKLDLDRNLMREMAEVAKRIEGLYHRPKEER